MPGHCSHWTETEEYALREAVAEGRPMKEVIRDGTVAGRSLLAVRNKVYRMGLARKCTRWTETDLLLLADGQFKTLLSRYSPAQLAYRLHYNDLQRRRAQS